MNTATLFALLVFLLPLAYSPGPGNAFFALSGARHGLVKSTPALLGYHVATIAVTLLLGSGLSVSLLTSPQISFALSTGSAAYMLWLAFGCFKERKQNGAAAVVDGSAAPAPGFWEGAFVLLLNPKAYAIIFLMFASFLKPSDGFAPVMLITLIFTFNNYLAFVAWTIAGQLLSKWLNDRIANIIYGVAFVGVALWILSGLIPI
jgi:threonine/homoserine/homoserine lactone efflux protein